MRLRTLSPLLGAAAALTLALSGCGSQSNIKGALSEASNTKISNELSAVSDAVNGTSCSRARGALSSLDATISGLPPATNAQLVANLRQGAATLRGLALKECHGTKTVTTTSSSTTSSTTTSAPTTTTPPTTTTATTTTTTTTSAVPSNTDTVPGTGGVTTLQSPPSNTGTNGGGGLGGGTGQ